MLRGAVAAGVTPLRDGGAAVDEDAVVPYVDFLVDAGIDGVLALGTTGEGILLRIEERMRVAELYVGAARGRLRVAVHAGAQTTADTIALAEHARAVGADAVAVIGPPYFAYDDRALFEHFVAAAAASDPTPFYVYEFQARAGYALSPELVRRVARRAPNFAGMKVSDREWDLVEQYLAVDVDVLVGAEELVARGLATGAVGAISGAAAAFPAALVAVVREPTAERGAKLAQLPERFERGPFHASAKLALQAQGVPMLEDVRAPLRRLLKAERDELATWLASS